MNDISGTYLSFWHADVKLFQVNAFSMINNLSKVLNKNNWNIKV